MHHVRNEHLALRSLSHPFIVELQGAFQTADHLHLALEWCPGGNLLTLVRGNGRLSTELARFYLAQVS